VAFARVLLGHPDRVEVEVVVVSLREPEKGLVAAGEPVGAVQAVLEVPDDAVAELEAVAGEGGVERDVRMESRK
jgi:hypothetical protein